MAALKLAPAKAMVCAASRRMWVAYRVACVVAHSAAAAKELFRRRMKSSRAAITASSDFSRAECRGTRGRG
jgi:hypothetical protein